MFGPGMVTGLLGWRSRLPAIPYAAGATAIGYVVMVGLWWPAWNGDLIDSPTGIFFSQFVGLTGLVAAAAWRPTWAFATLAIVPVVSVVNHVVRTPAFNGPVLPEITFSFAFCVVPVAAGIVAVRTAGVLDRTRSETYRAAAETGATRARADARRRVDELTHDGVMSTLLAAARQEMSPALARQAADTLADIDALASDAQDDRTLDADAAVAVLRSVVTPVDPSLRVRVEVTIAAASYPSEVVRTVAAAAAEAVRNSVIHAGPGVVRFAEVTFGQGPSLSVEIVDDGVGFDPRAVPPHRLGVAVSIRRRMTELPGGSVTVSSRPGAGTRVLLGWTA